MKLNKSKSFVADELMFKTGKVAIINTKLDNAMTDYEKMMKTTKKI